MESTQWSKQVSMVLRAGFVAGITGMHDHFRRWHIAVSIYSLPKIFLIPLTSDPTQNFVLLLYQAM